MALKDKIAARDALQRVLDDPRPWHEVAKGWIREQIASRLAGINAEIEATNNPQNADISC